MLSLRLSCFSTLLAVAACGGTEEPETHGVEEELCEHLTSGPFQPITAATSTTGTVPSAKYEHTAVQIDLVDGAGFVSYAADEAADYVIGMSEDVPLTIWQSGAEVEIEMTERGSEQCEKLKVTHTVELSVGTATLQLGPSSVDRVEIVVEEGGEHGPE